MKVPSDVIWQLTKKWNSKLVKFNGQTLSRDPLNLTGLHNASSSGTPPSSFLGMSNHRSIGLQAKKEKTKKKFRRVFSLLVKHKESNRDIKKKKNSKSGLQHAVNDLRSEVHRAGKTIQKLEISKS